MSDTDGYLTVLTQPASDLMHDDLSALIDALHRLAFDAGRALLTRADCRTLEQCVHRYNELCIRLREVAPALACPCRPLPHDASPGHVRLAARDAARRAARLLASSCYVERSAA